MLLVGFLVLSCGAHWGLRSQTDLFLTVEAQRIADSANGQDGPDLGDVRDAVLSPAMAPGTEPQTGLGRLLFQVIYIRVLTRGDHRVLATSPDLEHHPTLLPALDALMDESDPKDASLTFAGPDEERKMRVLTRRIAGGRTGLWLQVAVPYDHYQDLVENLSLALGLGLLSLLALAALGSWILVGRTLQPIQRIATEAGTLNADNVFDVVLPTTETDSEIGHLVRTLNLMLGRLNRTFQAQQRFADAQQRFAADASHELRTPLTILRGEMEVSLSRPRTAESYQNTVKSAIEEIDRMTQIVQALSFLARQDALQLAAEPVREPIDLRELTRCMVADFDKMASDKGLTLMAPGAGEPAVVQGDVGQLQQLLRNLIENAIKYTEKGKVTVELTPRSSPGGFILAVEDTGIGISDEGLGHVFERFWRADRARATPGSGLGLAISKRIAEAHNGDLRVSSRLGKGSRFELFLPCV
ncbi:MAG TPA: HAMP domain-containing sensor histidine kinase [Candidatus Xenobia bacterium]